MKFSFDVYSDCQAKIMKQKNIVTARLPYLDDNSAWDRLMDQMLNEYYEENRWWGLVSRTVRVETHTPNF